MELPSLPAERGHSRGVRRRVEQSLPAIRVAVAFVDVVREALDRMFGERVKRLEAARREAPGDGGRERYLSVPDCFYNAGLEIATARDEMVRADLELAAQRRVRRRACDRRDRVKRRLYDARVEFKKAARERLGRERWRLAPCLEGETVRDPYALALQAQLDLDWAEGRASSLCGLDGRPVDWRALSEPLGPLVLELRSAIEVVEHEAAMVVQKLEPRIWAVKAFDEQYGKSARLLETMLLLVGLPTLATAVRPHLKVAGRVGRPKKSPPADNYPDLVERARSTGLLPEVAEERTAAEPVDERHRLAAWMAAYREAIVPYLSFLAGLRARRVEGGGSGTADAAAGRRSAAAWPARALARWRGRGAS